MIEVLNLSDATAKRVQSKEFAEVIVQAGWVNGAFGVVFKGQICQTKRGKLNATDSFLRIYAQDGDYFSTQYTHAQALYVHRELSAMERFKIIQDDAVKNAGVQPGPIEGLAGFGGILPRSKVIWGSANQNLDTTSRPYGQWSIQQGKLQFRPQTGYLPGEAVVLNSKSGLVSQPEATETGIYVTALLNPAVKVGRRIWINNGEVNSSEPPIATTQVQRFGFPSITTPIANQLFASTAEDGTYVVLQIEYELSSRENPFYMHLVCLLQDASTKEIVPGAAAVPPPAQP